MKVFKSRDTVLFQTTFSDECDLVQKFTGIEEFPYIYNRTLNFTEAGLIFRKKWDVWHIDIPFSISNDEAPPVIINGKWIGANHEFNEAVSIHIPKHGKTASDIGSIWKDAEGTKWVMISAQTDTLTFISENIGESDVDYKFKKKITSHLTYMENGTNTEDICAECESWAASLKPIIRHTERRVTVFVDGEERTLNCSVECDYARIYEEYEIVNPVSMIEEICKNRPEGGYKTEICSAMGKAMAKVKRIYRIENDGAVLCEFHIERLMDIKLTRCLGAMFQEKLDVYGGGVYRYIPKTTPLVTERGNFDFSTPAEIASDSYPENLHLTEKYWSMPGNPPDRIVDCFRNRDGKDSLAFVCGYLPLYDALASIRTEKLGSAVHIFYTRKGYPFFFDKEFESAHGVAYRKYFKPAENGVSFYTIPYMDKEYLYVDLFKEGSISIALNGNIELYEKSEEINYNVKDEILNVFGKKGYAVFIIEK